jgi:uncharacterized membrane protein YfcA
MPFDPSTLLILLLVGVAAGFLAGLLGVGGGILLVPAMVLLLEFDQHVAQGTSLAVIVPAALIGSWTHYRRGTIRPRDAVLVAVGGVIGAAIGSLSALSLDDELLQRLFALVLLAVAIRMLLPKRSVPPDSDVAEGEGEGTLFGRVPEQD